MAPGDTIQGRRRENVRFADLPDDPQVGDYWRWCSRLTMEPMECDDNEHAQGNLTRGVWALYTPGGVAYLRVHTVREHEDGTISIRPGDGSSNSVLVHGPNVISWHGYVERGVLREV